MGTNLDLIKRADELVSALSETDLSVLNLDELVSWIELARTELAELENIRTECTVLREDYIDRLSGMAKAIAAVRHSHDFSQETLEFVQQLPSMNATDLIANYRKMSARFRDSFPTSLGGPNGGAINVRCKHAHEYK